MIDKAEAYDEALERAKHLRDDCQKELDKTDKNSQLAVLLRTGISAVEMIFPQLKESEDEKIRKAIIKSIEEDSSVYEQEVSKEQMIAYLENQKEQNEDSSKFELKTPEWVCGGWDDEYMINTVIGRYSLHAEVAKKCSDTHDYNLSKSMENWLRNVVKPLILEKQKEQKHTLKFKVGDKVHLDGDENINLTITGIEVDRYLTDCGPILFGAEDIWERVEQKPVEKPDIVAKLKHHLATTPKEQLDKEWDDLKEWSNVGPTVEEYLYGKPVGWSEEDESFLDSIEEAISDYYDLNHAPQYHYWLEEKLKSLRPQKLDASKLENFDPVDVLNRIKTEWPMAWEKVVGKLEWSEENEKIRQSIIKDIEFERNYTFATTGKVIEKYNEQIAWLKSLPERFNLQPKQEWNEEDDMLMDELESYILYDNEFSEEQKKWRIKRLKSLRPQPKQEQQIKEGDKVHIHCRKDREKNIIAIYDGKVGEVIHVWDKKYPWGHINVKLDNDCNNSFHEDELEVLDELPMKGVKEKS